jgi:hypothetical protein
MTLKYVRDIRDCAAMANPDSNKGGELKLLHVAGPDGNLSGNWQLYCKPVELKAVSEIILTFPYDHSIG